MRRKDREVKDYDEIIDILSRCKILHLALTSEGKPYSVPLNFGYVLEEDADTKKLSLYFHCAPEGKKLDAIKENPELSFQTGLLFSKRCLFEHAIKVFEAASCNLKKKT